MRLYKVLMVFIWFVFLGAEVRAQDRATVIACWQNGATNIMLMQMCSGSLVPENVLISCLSGGPCGGTPQPIALGQFCGARGLPYCPLPQPCGRPFSPLTIACGPPAFIWAPACGAPPYPPCMEPHACGLFGTFPCPIQTTLPQMLSGNLPGLNSFLAIDPTLAFIAPGGMPRSPGGDLLGMRFAAPSIPDLEALQECQDNSFSEEDFFACVTEEALPEDYRQIASCVEDYEGDPARQALCSIGNNDATEAYETYVEVRDCIEEEGEDTYDVADCLGQSFLGENERYYQRCITDNKGDLYQSAACALAKDLTPEQQIAVSCAVRTGGNPKAFAICTGGQLTARELGKCWDHGIGTDEGCFGPNNDLRRAADDVRDGVCNATGENSIACQAYGFWHDNVLMPGPNHEAVKIINNGISDIRNGPGENNEFVKAGKAVEGVFQSVGSALGF